MKVKRTGLWRGLTSLMCFFLALSIMAGNILEANAATIDTYMGTQSERMESDGALYDKFKPSAEAWRLPPYFSAMSFMLFMP